MKKDISESALELTKEMDELNNKERVLSRKLIEYNTYIEIKEKNVSKYSDKNEVLKGLKELSLEVKALENALDNIYDTKDSLKKQLKTRKIKYSFANIIGKVKRISLTKKK